MKQRKKETRRRRPGAGPKERTVEKVLDCLEASGGQAWYPSREAAAAVMGVSRRSLYRAVAQMRLGGLVRMACERTPAGRPGFVLALRGGES